MQLRRWRDRANKIIHAYDADQFLSFPQPFVKTLCGFVVLVTRRFTYGDLRVQLDTIPTPGKYNADLPKPSTKLTCMSCIALTW